MLLKQQNANADSLDLSSLTLKEPPPMEEVVTDISSAKVSLIMHIFAPFFHC